MANEIANCAILPLIEDDGLNPTKAFNNELYLGRQIAGGVRLYYKNELGVATVLNSGDLYLTEDDMTAHINDIDPHSQYTTQSEVDDTITDHVNEIDPHTQYLTSDDLGSYLEFKGESLGDLDLLLTSGIYSCNNTYSPGILNYPSLESGILTVTTKNQSGDEIIFQEFRDQTYGKIYYREKNGTNAFSDWIGDYLTQSNASSTYLTQSNASSTYQKKITISTSAPSGGVDGDIWIRY